MVKVKLHINDTTWSTNFSYIQLAIVSVCTCTVTKVMQIAIGTIAGDLLS